MTKLLVQYKMTSIYVTSNAHTLMHTSTSLTRYWQEISTTLQHTLTAASM